MYSPDSPHQTSMLHSMVVTVDGPSKAGTTEVISRIGRAAEHIDTRFSQLIAEDFGNILQGKLGQPRETVSEWAALHRLLSFDDVNVIRGGNYYRALALYVIENESRGVDTRGFGDDDTERLRELLARDGIQSVLDHDPRIGTRVSDIVRNYAGAQALCSTMLCDAVVGSYGNGVGTLTIVDARNPEQHHLRPRKALSLLGLDPNTIDPASVVPLYIETPVTDAASRLPGDPADNAMLIESRRQADASRPEMPVAVPERFADSWMLWRMQLGRLSLGDTIDPLLFRNDASVSLGDLTAFARFVAASARDAGETLYAQKLHMQATLPDLTLLPGTTQADVILQSLDFPAN